VFLHDSIGVLSRPADRRETTEMKHLYSKNIKLASQTTLPNSKHCDLVESYVMFNRVGIR